MPRCAGVAPAGGDILLVADRIQDAGLLKSMPELGGHPLRHLYKAMDALAQVKGVAFSQIMLDLMMPGLSGS